MEKFFSIIQITAIHIIAVAVLAWPNALAGYSSIYVFGDGVCTTTQNPPPQPASLYYGARYCNDLVWIEVLSDLRGVTYDASKNNSFFGHDSNALLTTTASMVSPADASTALFIVWSANADFVNFATQISAPYGNMAPWNSAISQSLSRHSTAITTLYNKGARKIVMPNAADIMAVPFYNNFSAIDRAFVRARVSEFNTQFTTTLNNLESTLPDLVIIRPDMFTFFDNVLSNPVAHDMVNPNPYVSPFPNNAAILNEDISSPWVEGVHFVFWDEYHPTAKFQAALANHINGLIPNSDTVPPVISLPSPTPIVEASGPNGAVVSFSTSANDAVDGPVPTTANPPSGSTFPLGNTTVTVSATDAAGNTATGNFTVTVRDTTPPALTLPGTLVREATGPSGAVVTFSTSASDTVSGSRPTTATPPSGSTFPLGNTTVMVSASDAAGNVATGSFTVTVSDTTPPVLTLPGTLIREAIGPNGAVVTFSTLANDTVSGSRPTTANPPSGSTFPLGNTTVMVSASDAAGNVATGSFTVTVSDTTPPVLTLPGTLIREATGPNGAVVTFSTSANDTVSGSRPTTANPPSGSTFPLGNSTVTVSATDAAGNTATGNFTVTVRDTTPPALTLPGTLVREATGSSGAVVTFSTSASDTVSGSRPTTANPPSGSTFPLGNSTVTVSATDAAGNVANGSFKVTVVNMAKLLQNVAIAPAGTGFPAIAGQIQGGPPNGQVILQASADLGKNDPWRDIGTIPLDANGNNQSFGPVFDPQGLGLARGFFRIKLPISP